jgi:hypothetical protein
MALETRREETMALLQIYCVPSKNCAVRLWQMLGDSIMTRCGHLRAVVSLQVLLLFVQAREQLLNILVRIHFLSKTVGPHALAQAPRPQTRLRRRWRPQYG